MSKLTGERLRKVPWTVRYRLGAQASSELRRLSVLATHRHCHVEFRGPVRLGPGFELHIPDHGSLTVGVGVDFRRGFVCEISDGGRVTIGDGSIFTSNALIQCTTSIDIGRRCVFGQSVLLVDGRHRFRDASRSPLDQGYEYRPLLIDDDVMVMAKCTIFSDIGRRTIVGAHSVVSRPLPPYCLALGAPAQPVEFFDDPGAGEGQVVDFAGQIVEADEGRIIDTDDRHVVQLDLNLEAGPPGPPPATCERAMSNRLTGADFTVVIPTRDRWQILGHTLDGLARQEARGFDTVVVVDGTDQEVPDLPALDEVRVLIQEHAGPGAARNTGACSSSRPILLFLGDDMVPEPDLVTRHIDSHIRHPEHEVAVLGRAEWHPEAARGRIQRWMDWSGTQFDYGTITDEEAGFGRFFSCNVSLKREFFLDSGGFDEAFNYYYEDLDCGWRLAQKGMRLLYEPAARTAHLHRYDRDALERRFRGVAVGEHLMASKHAWFEPFFLGRVRAAMDCGAPNALWPWLVDLVPPRALRLRRRAESRANIWYYRAMAEPFLAGWAAAEDLAELQQYLGAAYDHSHLVGHQRGVDSEREAAVDEETFYRTSREYLYDLTVFAMSGTKAPYLAELRAMVPRGNRILDYGCGIGADGLRLAADGYDVSYADFANPSTSYLRWRLERRGLDSAIYDLDKDEVPSGFDAAYCFDVIEHVGDPFDLLERLERRANLVAVNFLEEDPDDTDLHRHLPIAALLDHASDRGMLRYRRYHRRSHFVIYQSPFESQNRAPRTAPPASRLHSSVQRRLGSHLKGRPPWYPLPRD